MLMQALLPSDVALISQRIQPVWNEAIKMAIETEAFSLELENATRSPDLSASTAIASYWSLTKPEVNMLVVVTTGVAFCLASARNLYHFPALALLNVIVGTSMTSGGSCVLNQYIERRFDARMRRTSRRPLATGTVRPIAALYFGLLLSVMGALYLAIAVNAVAALLAVLASVAYLLIYTPLKRITPLCTLVGAFPGAVPPLIGWAAASGRLNLEAWVLYSFLFLWQFPHFMAIAWMYREDYARAGYRVLPGRSGGIPFMMWQTVLPLLVAIPVSIVPKLLGYAGWVYAGGALVLSCLFLGYGVKLAVTRTNSAARRLLFVSIAYLPTVLVLLMLDRG
jgi:protoheme IX farnesyltransferase